MRAYPKFKEHSKAKNVGNEKRCREEHFSYW